MNGIRTLIKQTEERFLTPSTLCAHLEMTAVYKPGISHQTPNLLKPWSWTPSLKPWEITYLLLISYWVFGTLLEKIKWTKQWCIREEYSHTYFYRQCVALHCFGWGIWRKPEKPNEIFSFSQLYICVRTDFLHAPQSKQNSATHWM